MKMDYCGVDYGIVREVVSNQLPPLLPNLKAISSAMPPIDRSPTNLSEFL